jgi:Outer membrane protein beta-barrel domain
MKHYFLILSTLFTFVLSQAQERKFSLEANYPLPIEDGFVFRNYTGIIDLGLKYRFYETEVFSLGAGINGGILIANFNTYYSKIKTTNYIVQPKIITEFKLKNSKIHPYVSLGWSFMTFVAEGNTSSLDVEQTKVYDSNSQGGINLTTGALFDVSKRVFINFQFDFTNLNKKGNVPNTSYNTQVLLLKAGVGFRI